jgi:hypothetical protein
MPADYFTVEENSWLRGLSKEYERFTLSGGESALYLQGLFNAFLRCFPYRHAQNVNHDAGSGQAPVIYAEDFSKVLEVRVLRA